jgi:hypothetical protein
MKGECRREIRKAPEISEKAPDAEIVLLQGADEDWGLGGKVSYRPHHPGHVGVQKNPRKGATPLVRQVGHLCVGRKHLLHPLHVTRLLSVLLDLRPTNVGTILVVCTPLNGLIHLTQLLFSAATSTEILLLMDRSGPINKLLYLLILCDFDEVMGMSAAAEREAVGRKLVLEPVYGDHYDPSNMFIRKKSRKPFSPPPGIPQES